MAVDEIEAVVIDGEVAVLVDIGLIDLLLLLLEDDLARNQDIFVVNVISVEIVEFIFPSLAFEIVGVGKQFDDLREEGPKEVTLGHSSHEVIFERRENDHILIDGVHPRKGLFVLLHFLEAVIGYIKSDDLGFDASVSSVYVLVSDDIADPLKILSHRIIPVCHNASILFENHQQNHLFNDTLKVMFEVGFLVRLHSLL